MTTKVGCTTAGRAEASDRSIAIVTSIAYSLANFRGPLIESLVAAGWRVHALAPDYDHQSREKVKALGAEPIDFPMERAGMDPRGDLRTLFALIGQFRTLRPDVVLSYFVKPVIYGSIAARIAGVARRYALVAGLGYVFTDDGDQLGPRRRTLHFIVTRLYHAAFSSCRRVFFQNDDDIDEMVAAGAIDRSRAVRVNGTGVDLDKLSPAPPVIDPPTFLLMARLLREKGVVEYVEAARIVRARHPAVRVILLGDVDANPGALTRRTVLDWVAEGAIEWPGHVDDVHPWIEAASVYVLPSYYREGVPRSTQEAMATGRAVITTDSTGCRDTVVDGQTGFLVPVRDVPALARAMLRFVEEPRLIVEMGRASRALAEARFDVHAINRRMLAEMGIDAGLAVREDEGSAMR